MLNFPRNKTIKSSMSSGMPNVADTLNGWEIPITLIVITQDVIDGDLSPTATEVNFMGVWQPLRSEQLALKPDGQRSWEWCQLHVKSGVLNLETGDKVKYNNRIFKVESKKDYGLNGYVEYELCRDYEEGSISDEEN